jgi:hypothetical protein
MEFSTTGPGSSLRYRRFRVGALAGPRPGLCFDRCRASVLTGAGVAVTAGFAGRHSEPLLSACNTSGAIGLAAQTSASRTPGMDTDPGVS